MALLAAIGLAGCVVDRSGTPSQDSPGTDASTRTPPPGDAPPPDAPAADDAPRSPPADTSRPSQALDATPEICRAPGCDGEGGASVVALLPGECADAQDCSGKPCIELTPGGPQTCQNAAGESLGCDTPTDGGDACCASADCDVGARCFLLGDYDSCGGGGGGAYRACMADVCSTDADCPGGICAPPGTVPDVSGDVSALTGPYPVRTCLAADCRRDADCTASPAGRCWLSALTSCDPGENHVARLVCVYPGDCTRSSDCGPDQHCNLVGGRPTCLPGSGP